MGKGTGGRGGGGGIYRSLSRFRLFRGIFGGYGSVHNDMLKRIAISRGLRDVDELLVVLGKQETGVSTDEAFDLLEKEAGIDAVVDAIYDGMYAGGRRGHHCQKLLRVYKEVVVEGKELGENDYWDISYMKHLKKYCGFNAGE
ncbi:hypothetical protein SOVF_165190 isoform A [Spinacia oleracea]|uniref:Uncharacterized protein isoform X2 n=1 Tax=Spinacia oleracea TaxID=3562 RepID=A0A9R0J9P6_SPIOL|nr:uncharacterized protein LOC110802871 isoform X2 [Spinacia oleracea]KNA08152.1 hypothetical protein SOVF_165190 isoform A [Spinacia oleracea]